MVGPFYDRLVAAIREIDPHHILFIDGNTYSTDFTAFSEPYENAIYACHDYARSGMSFGGPYPGETQGVWVDRDAVEETFLKRTRWQRETGTPLWVGEFGPVYTGDPERDEQRYQLLADQLEIYARHGAGWSIWTYKDVGLQGLVHVAPDSAYMQRFGDLIAKKARPGDRLLGLDRRRGAGGRRAAARADRGRVPRLAPYPWSPRATTDDLVRHILFAQAMLPEYAERFRGLDDADARRARGFLRAVAVRKRTRLCELLASRTGTAAGQA